MDEKKLGIILSALLAIFVIISATFFNASGLTTSQFLNANPIPLIKIVISLNFIGFILSASICIGLVLTIGKKYLFNYALGLIYAGGIIGTIISCLVFPITLQFLPVLVFAFIGVPMGIKYLNEREIEVKYMPHLRSGISASGRLILVLLVGLFICLLLAGIEKQSELETKFIPELLSSTFGSSVNLGDQITNQLATQMITQQQNTIDQVNSILKNSNNPDLDPLIAQLNAKKIEAGSEQSLTNIINQMKAQKIDLGAEIVKQFPIIKIMAKLAWIIYAISGFIIMLFLANIIVKNLSALFYSTILLLLPKIINPKEKHHHRSKYQKLKALKTMILN